MVRPSIYLFKYISTGLQFLGKTTLQLGPATNAIAFWLLTSAWAATICGHLVFSSHHVLWLLLFPATTILWPCGIFSTHHFLWLHRFPVTTILWPCCFSSHHYFVTTLFSGHHYFVTSLVSGYQYICDKCRLSVVGQWSWPVGDQSVEDNTT